MAKLFLGPLRGQELEGFLGAEWARVSIFYRVHSDPHGHTEPLMQAYYSLSNPGAPGCGVGTIIRGSGAVEGYRVAARGIMA